MEIDRQGLVDAGVRYIYQLDDFPKTSVEKQISLELDEILELNQAEILNSRLDWIGIGEASDYLNRWIETNEGYVLAGIRHFSGNREKPFVYIWPSFKIESIGNVIESIEPHFKMFRPKHYHFWCRPDCNGSGSTVIQQRFIGKIQDMKENYSELEAANNYYDWYRAEYHEFHKRNPEYVDRIPENSQELMDRCLDEGLLYFLIEEGRKVGLIAGENEVFLGQPSVYLNEILVARAYRGKGYAKTLLGSFVNLLNAKYFLCHIDIDNIPSTKTALWSGQKVFSQECSIAAE